VYRSSRANSAVDSHERRAASDLVCSGSSSSAHRESFDGLSDSKLVNTGAVELQDRRASDMLVVPSRE